MEFKDLPTPLQEMASNIVRSQLATLDLSTAEKETIDNMVRNVRNAFSGLYGSDNQKQESDVNKQGNFCLREWPCSFINQNRNGDSLRLPLHCTEPC
ncbi:hypothetical protein OkiPb00117_47720 [Escherichia coli]